MTVAGEARSPQEPSEETAEAPASAAPASAAPAPAPAVLPRRWLWKLRRVVRSTPESPPRPAPDSLPGADQRTSLADRSPFQIGFFLALGAMTAYGLVNAVTSLQSVVVIVLLSLYLALGLNPAVEGLRRRGLGRGIAVALVAFVLLGVLTLGGWAVVPVVTDQVNTLYANMPGYLQNLRENPQIAEFDRQFDVINSLTQFLSSGSWLQYLFGGILGASRAVASLLFSTIITVVFTLYFLASLPSIRRTVHQLAPASRRARVAYLVDQFFSRVGGFLTGMFAVVSLWATLAFVFLNIAGLGGLSLALAIVVAAFAAIPVVGTTAAIVILALVAFSSSTAAGVGALVIFVVYQQLDAYLIQPRIFERSVNVPGVLVVLAAISGGFLLGIVGALLAIPTTAGLMLLYREVLVPHLNRT